MPVFNLALALTRAGGRRRIASVIVGTTVSTFLLLVAGALPSAIFPAGPASMEQRYTGAMITGALIAPVTVLLLIVGRLSSATRDRRLASLRLLGVSPAKARRIGMTENIVLSFPAALIALALFYAVAPAVNALVDQGPKWFVRPLSMTPGLAAGVVFAVVALSAVVSLASLRALGRSPREMRSLSVRKAPSPWRLLVLVFAVADLVWLVSSLSAKAPSGVQSAALIAAPILAAAAISLAAPVLASWVARVLARPQWTAGLLAGRGVQAEPASSGRVVAGLGVSVLLVVCAFGFLAAYKSDPVYQYEAHMFESGPMLVWAAPRGDGDGLTSKQVSALTNAPGVHIAVPVYGADDVRCNSKTGEYCGRIFIGTCAGLSATMVVTGCSDQHAAAITLRDPHDRRFSDGEPARASGSTPPSVTIARYNTDKESGYGTVGDGARVAVPIDGSPIVNDAAASVIRGGQSGEQIFVPIGLVKAAVGDPVLVDLWVDKGSTDSVVAAGRKVGLDMSPYPADDNSYVHVQKIQLTIWVLSIIVVGIGLLGFILGAIDRAFERRRLVARQIAVGVPGRVLRTGQLLQTLMPLTITMALAIGLGIGMDKAWSHLMDLRMTIGAGTIVALVVSVALGILAVSVATIPTIRTRLTPELLRRE